jgi:nicotinamidase/pyrazinamidase
MTAVGARRSFGDDRPSPRIRYSAVNARQLGFNTILIEAGCRAIDLAGSLEAAWAEMNAAGVQRFNDLS